NPNWEPPDYCLIRFFDVSVDPGKTYEYRYRLKMKNPNKGKKDEVAYGDLATKESVFSPWFDLGQRETIPPDFHFYAVDTKELEAKRSAPPQDQVAFQLHRWVDQFAPPDAGQPEAVGDWAVVERVLYHRGEFIGGKHKVQLPRWNSVQEQFELAVDPKERRPKPVEV